MKIIFPTLILLFFLSCQSKNRPHIKKFQLLLPDTSKTHRPNKLFSNLRNWERQMHLPRIDTGVGDFEIRLWTSSMIDPDQMVLVRKADTNVIAQTFDYNTNIDSIEHFKLTNTYNSILLKKFADSLQRLDFSKMISQAEIANFQNNIADGITYHLEVSTSKYYKLVTYHCPEHFAPKEENNKRFVDLVLAMDNHLHFHWPICATK